jgi:hypothetical protein
MRQYDPTDAAMAAEAACIYRSLSASRRAMPGKCRTAL